jgi:hypothetical protein
VQSLLKEDMAAHSRIVTLSLHEARDYRSMTVMARGFSCRYMEEIEELATMHRTNEAYAKNISLET